MGRALGQSSATTSDRSGASGRIVALGSDPRANRLRGRQRFEVLPGPRGHPDQAGPVAQRTKGGSITEATASNSSARGRSTRC